MRKLRINVEFSAGEEGMTDRLILATPEYLHNQRIEGLLVILRFLLYLYLLLNKVSTISPSGKFLS